MKLKDFLKERTGIVGLDIAENTIQAAALGKFASIPTPPDSIKDGAIAAPDKIAKALRQLWKENKIKSRRVSLALHGTDLLLHIITIPYAKDEAIPSILENKVNQYVIFAGLRTVIGWEKLSEGFEAGEKRLKVLLAVAKRELVDSYISAAEKAGLRVNAVVLPSLAVIRYLLAGRIKSPPKEKMLFVHVDAGQTFMHILEDGVNLFVHSFDLGAKDFFSSSDKIRNRIDEIQKKFRTGSEVKNIIIHFSDPKIKDLTTEFGKRLNIEMQVEFNLVPASLDRSEAVKINLLPNEVKNVQEWRLQIIWFLYSVVGLSFFMLALFFMFYLGGFILNRQIDKIKSELNKPGAQFVLLKEIEGQTEEVKRLIAGREQIIERFQAFPWDDVFAELNRIAPAHLYLTKIEINPEEAVIISGVTESSDYIFDFMLKLKASQYFKNVDLQVVKDAEKRGEMASFVISAEKK